MFIDRQHLLRFLYENLQHKTNVLTKKRVIKIETAEKGVQVTTTDGEMFMGDVLVGADGVHSTVRREMWRLGKEQNHSKFREYDEPSKIFHRITRTDFHELVYLNVYSMLHQVYVRNFQAQQGIRNNG